jgi:uncharacterized protein YjdB
MLFDKLPLVCVGALLSSSACSRGGAAGPPALQAITVLPASDSVELGFGLKLTATGTYADGSRSDLTRSASWSSTDPTIASVDAEGNATPVGIGRTTIEASLGSIRGSMALTVTPTGLLENAGIYTQFERRGWASEYHPGQTIQSWADFDPVVGSTVASRRPTRRRGWDPFSEPLEDTLPWISSSSRATRT